MPPSPEAEPKFVSSAVVGFAEQVGTAAPPVPVSPPLPVVEPPEPVDAPPEPVEPPVAPGRPPPELPHPTQARVDTASTAATPPITGRKISFDICFVLSVLV